MKSLGINEDWNGRQAFAFLAIMLIVLSSGYISYLMWLEREGREDSREALIIEGMTSDLQSVSREMEFSLIEVHDSIFLDIVNDPGSWNSSSIDSELEGRLVEIINNTVEDILEKRIGDMSASIIRMDDASISVIPVKASQLMPTSGVDEGNSPDGAGPWTYGWRPCSCGVNTTISISLIATDGSEDTAVRDEFSINIVRESEEGLLIERLGRLEKALHGPELKALYQHMLSSLANAKAYLGYGRDQPRKDSFIPPPLLTDDEMSSVMDLSVNLLTCAYLGDFDEQGLSSVEHVLRDQRNSFGCSPSITQILEKNNGTYDPGRLMMAVEGLFSEECPPSMDQMVRPLLLSIVERLAIGLVNFIGLDSPMMGAAGGFVSLCNMLEDLKDSICETVTGKESVDEVKVMIKSATLLYYEDDDRLDTYPGEILVPSIPGKLWNDHTIMGYPEIDPDPARRSFRLAVRNETSGLVSVYDVDSVIDLPVTEPIFDKTDLFDDDTYLDGAKSHIGADEGLLGIEMSAREIAEGIVRSVINEFLSDIAENGASEWELIWEGWDSQSPPPIGKDTTSWAGLISLSMGYLPEMAARMAPMIAEQIADTDFMDLLGHMNAVVGDALADYIYDNYDTLTGRMSQVVGSMNRMVPRILTYSNVDVINMTYIGSEPSSLFHELPTLDEALCEDSILVGQAYNISYEGTTPISDDGEGGLFDILYTHIDSSFETVRMREFGPGDAENEMGVIRQAFTVTPTRGGGVPDLDDVADSLTDALEGLARGIFNDISGCESLSGTRYFLPYPGHVGSVISSGGMGDGSWTKAIPVDVDITSRGGPDPVITGCGGDYDPNPTSSDSPYSSEMRVSLKRSYSISYSSAGGPAISLDIDIPLEAEFTTYTVWPMAGIDYQTGDTLVDIAIDRAREVVLEMTDALMDSARPLVSDSMSSLKELPPIVMDLVESGEFDLSEVGRVLTNITMDLSSTLRESIKGLILNIIESGVSTLLSRGLSILGMDEFEIEVRIGPLELSISSEREALEGGDGSLLKAVCNIPVIGLNAFLALSREGSDIRFNGTAAFTLPGFHLRMEIDPFMDVHPHMISVEGYLACENDRKIRFSFAVPSLEEYRVTEVSLSSTLGLEPFVPIPPLGIQAVFDGGFRMRYRMPEELPPVLNEVHFTEGSPDWIEIYDPREIPFGGSTLEIRDCEDILISSWMITDSPEIHSLVEIDTGNPWMTGSGNPKGSVRVILRSPSGIPMDQVSIDEVREGSFSRENDGYGIWRWEEGTPGYSNGGSGSVSIRTVIISLAITTIREAWEEAFGLFGLSFDTITHFLQRSVDLFMERFIEMVSSILIDLGLFLSIEVEDASGTGGLGMEMELSADGDAAAIFLEWLYENIKILMSSIGSPQSGGDLLSFPTDILEKCWISMTLFTEVEIPVSVSNFAPEGSTIPDSITIGVTQEINIALPLDLMGMDAGDWHISFGVMVADAPDVIVSMFYDLTSTSMRSDLWLVKGNIWESDQ